MEWFSNVRVHKIPFNSLQIVTCLQLCGQITLEHFIQMQTFLTPCTLILSNKDHLMNMKGAVRDISKHEDLSCFFEPKAHNTFWSNFEKDHYLILFPGALISCVLLLLFLILLLPCFILLFLLILSLKSYYFRKKILFSTKLHLRFSQTN